MTYKYSICHPDKPKIEYLNQELSSYQVIEIIKYYPWSEVLKSMNNIEDGNIYYSPSLNFETITGKYSLEITATLEKGKAEFSLWYKKPINNQLSESTKLNVIDKWDFSLDKALDYYKLFLDKNYNELETLMNEKNR